MIATIRARWRSLHASITLDRHITMAQPWALLIGPLLLVAALMMPYRWLFFVSYVYLLLVVAAYAWLRHVGRRVVLRRALRHEWAQVGDTLDERWELINNAWLPLLWLEIQDNSTLPGYSGRRIVGAGIGERYEWDTEAICTRRGVYTLGPLTARLGDPFGLFRYEWREATTRQIVIYPPLVRLPPLTIPQGQRGGLAHADLLQQHTTPSVGGLREYVPGDLLSHIHWPTVARTQRLMVKEFDQERAGALWIALDLWAGAYPTSTPSTATQPRPVTTAGESAIYSAEALVSQHSTVTTAAETSQAESALELAVALTCSLAAQALAEGRAVGLLADDGRQRLLTPARGPRQLWRVLSELVDVQATGELTLAELLRRGQSAHPQEVAGAALVVVTPALDGIWLPTLAAWLRGKPGGALALLVSERAEQAMPLVGRLATSGIVAQPFEVGVALQLVNPPKTRTKVRVSPLGKVIEE